MNTVEGFFAVGAIVGPAIVATLIAAGVSWKWLYVIAATICIGLVAVASRVAVPARQRHRRARHARPDARCHQRSARARLLLSRHAIRGRRRRGLRLDADVSAVVRRLLCVARRLCADRSSSCSAPSAGSSAPGSSDDCLGPSRSSSFSLAISLCFVGSLVGGVDARRVAVAAVGAVHVDHVSDA